MDAKLNPFEKVKSTKQYKPLEAIAEESPEIDAKLNYPFVKVKSTKQYKPLETIIEKEAAQNLSVVFSITNILKNICGFLTKNEISNLRLSFLGEEFYLNLKDMYPTRRFEELRLRNLGPDEIKKLRPSFVSLFKGITFANRRLDNETLLFVILKLVELQNVHNCNIKELNFSDNNIGNNGIKTLANANLPNLRYLNLSYNKIGEEGFKSLLTSDSLKNLEILYFSHNKIGDNGIKTLANANLPNLRYLKLDYNKIGEEGFKSLLTSDSLKNLETLSFQYVLEEAYLALSKLESIDPNSVQLKLKNFFTNGYTEKAKSIIKQLEILLPGCYVGEKDMK